VILAETGRGARAMICVSTTAATEGALAADLAQAARVADLVEIRMDHAPSADLKRLLENRPCPVIVTNRPRREGGAFQGPEEDRLRLLQEAVDLGADYVDVELDSAGRLRRRGRTRLIVSYHNFQETPEDIGRIHSEIVRTGADVAKVACMARDIRDNLRMFDLLRATQHPTIALCMGELGVISRILGKKFGGFLTYASLGAGRESAPGQLSAAELAGTYRYRRIGPSTAIYGVIADPVAHSMSPAVHNAAFEEAGVDAVYVPFKVEGDVVEFVNAFRRLDVRGYSVTIPHKQAIIAAMDEVDEIARKVGALNTVVNRDGRLWGTNTDVTAALQALEDALGTGAEGQGSPLRGKRVLLVGAGGAARALAFGLSMRGARITIANRTFERGRRLADEVGAECCTLSDVGSQEADVVINTTSVGMHPHAEQTPVPRSALRPGMVVFDAVYNPLQTRLLREAREVGCTVISGVVWFVNQAAAQFELWTGRPAPRATMERALMQRLRGQR